MSVDRVLAKITDHNQPVIGCVVQHGDAVYDNLPPLYELIECLDVAEHARNLFELANTLETGPHGFEQVFLEFEEYSFFCRSLEDGVLVLLSEPIERSAFKRIQVGVNLFMKPLRRALELPQAQSSGSAEEPAAASSTGAKADTKPARQARVYRGIRY